MPPERASVPAAQRTGRLSAGRIVPVVAILLAAALVFATGAHRHLSLETLVRHRDALSAFVDAHYAAALLGFMAIYVTAVSLSLPGALFLTITGGFLFGTIAGGAAAVIAATTGASVIFLVARSAFGEYVVRRAGPRLSKILDGFCADAFSYLLFLRLVPLFPFFLVNLAPALVGVRLGTFVAATAIGIIPATLVFASVGAGLDSVIGAQASAYHACVAAGRGDCHTNFDPGAVLTPQLIGALVALGLLALVPVVVKRFAARRLGPACGSDAERVSSE
jgi:uncharacterized membrane protein YdjX (TVP38/TMEM64 family)